MHPFVTGRPAPSRALVRLLDYAIDLGDVWIARADQIARLVARAVSGLNTLTLTSRSDRLLKEHLMSS